MSLASMMSLALGSIYPALFPLTVGALEEAEVVDDYMALGESVYPSSPSPYS